MQPDAVVVQPQVSGEVAGVPGVTCSRYRVASSSQGCLTSRSRVASCGRPLSPDDVRSNDACGSRALRLGTRGPAASTRRPLQPIFATVPIPAGWYPDPLDTGRLRLWNGAAWTTGTMPRAAIPAADPVASSPAAYGVRALEQPSRTTPAKGPRHSARVVRPRRRIVGTALAGALAIATAATLSVTLTSAGASASTVSGLPSTSPSIPLASSTSGPALDVAACHTPVPRATSPAGRAYIAALNAASLGWSTVDARMRAEGNVVHVNDLSAQAEADAVFVQHLQRIRFPLATAATGADMIRMVQKYRSLLLAGVADPVTYAHRHEEILAVLQARQATSERLRYLLGLPAGVCSYLRPT